MQAVTSCYQVHAHNADEDILYLPEVRFATLGATGRLVPKLRCCLLHSALKGPCPTHAAHDITLVIVVA